MPRPMLAAFLALALGFAALPLFSVLLFHNGGAAAGALGTQTVTTLTDPTLAGQPVEPAAAGLTGDGCSRDEPGPAM
ncbi:MAG: hypothetical protein ACKVT1_17905 [Dehalococcoidia bacterium]